VSILAAASPEFAAMFKHDMKELKTGEVVLFYFIRNKILFSS
jgi:hypothetical protein